MAGQDIPRWMWALADDYPFASPPPGVIPNFEHPALIGYHSITIACTICITLVVLAAAARLYVKLRLIRKWGLDDYFFWLSVPLLLTTMGFYIYLDNHGSYGHHGWDLKIKALTKTVLVLTYLEDIFVAISNWFIRTTLLCLLLTAFKPVYYLRCLCYVGIVTMFCFYTANATVVGLACRPQGDLTDRVSWLAGMASSPCASTDGILQRYSIATGVFNVISDLYILLIPIPAVMKLQISKEKKISIMFIFSAGGLACIASTLSLIFRARLYGTDDLTAATIPTMATGMVELAVGLIITTFASLQHLARHVISTHFPGMLTQTTEKSSGPYQTIGQAPRRKIHYPGGLSDIDTMKTYEIKTGTFGTVDVKSAADSMSMKTLTSPTERSGSVEHVDLEDVEMQRVSLGPPA